MKVAAIISEYNPFHKGHKYHIERTKELCSAEYVIAIMSGNFVQRGDVALFPKEIRAKAAIASGVDLVVELPTIFAMQSAEFFAKNAVAIANSLGIVDFLSFGAECDDIEKIIETSKLLANEPPEFSDILKKEMVSGSTYPSAITKAVSEFLGDEYAEIISSPNNILGIEYCKALLSKKSSITPIAVKRIGSAHDLDAPEDEFASASLVRKLILDDRFSDGLSFTPDECKSIFENAQPHSIDIMEKSILAELIKIPSDVLSNISDVSEGLENRIKSAANDSSSLDELISSVKTKRYTQSRLRRIVISAYLGITNADRNLSVPYIKILDHNERGQELISKMKKSATLPIARNTSQINKLGDDFIKTIWERERTFDKIYTLSGI